MHQMHQNALDVIFFICSKSCTGCQFASSKAEKVKPTTLVRTRLHYRHARRCSFISRNRNMHTVSCHNSHASQGEMNEKNRTKQAQTQQWGTQKHNGTKRKIPHPHGFNGQKNTSCREFAQYCSTAINVLQSSSTFRNSSPSAT